MLLCSQVSQKVGAGRDTFTPWGISVGIANCSPDPTHAQSIGKKGKIKRETART